MTLTVYEFREKVLDETSTLPDVIKGSRDAVEKFIPLAEFPTLFGGYIRWRPPDIASEEMPGEGIGVWGRRNVSKFRRLLSERGADVRRVKEQGPKQTHLEINQSHDPR
jgi:hypothetical protein